MKTTFLRPPRPLMFVVLAAWLVLLIGVVDAVRWLFGAECHGA